MAIVVTIVIIHNGKNRNNATIRNTLKFNIL